MKYLIGAIFISFSMFSYSGTVGPAKIDLFVVGVNGLHGTQVKPNNVTFSGCSNTTSALLKGDNPNYKEFMSAILAAKMANKDVRLSYSSCEGAFSVITEVRVD